MKKNLLKGLNPQQLEAVTYFDSPLLILAGAGSGKTKVITHKIAYMVDKFSYEPERILAVTFTNKAAKEMKERVEKLLGKNTNVNVLTFHAFCVRVLKSHSIRIGFKPNFLIIDSEDKKSLIRKIVKELNLDPSLYNPSALSSVISKLKNETVTSSFDDRVEEIFQVYNQKLKEMNAFDFDDLLLFTRKLLLENEDIKNRYSQFFRYILIDEYQDTNRVQYEIARAITQEKGNICAVGDDDQCIYTWRGANINNILDFEKDFKDAKVIKLEKNYRCSATILEAANAVISRNRIRKGKKLYTDNAGGEPIRIFEAESDVEEANFISKTIKQLVKSGFKPSEVAVFYRTNAQSRAIEDGLRKEGIDYQIIGGLKFYERKEVKDIIAYLRFAVFEEDEISLFRILNTPKRGLGATTEKKLRELIDGGMTGLEALKSLIKISSPKQKIGLENLIDIVEAIREKVPVLPPYDLIRFIYSATSYEDFLKKQFPEDWESRAENVRELGNTLAEFSEREGINGEDLILEFLNSISLMQDQDDLKENERVTLMTVHSSKGLEFPVVFITGLEDGIFPHSRSVEEGNIEEERRLFYVAITRAKKLLTLSYSRRRRVFGSYRETIPSRFISEIPESLLKRASRKKEKIIPSRKIKLVFHPKFGKGFVKRIEGKGEDAKVTVIFERCGEKTIVKRFLKVLA